ncbi:MAG: SDR family NAD(P)-dependent oxidoreductase [Endomicrobia bacterium]|nr:SDR family NAD(P)-dependent oxidoreductase [Endomicrobiia bacterium]
MKKAIVLGATSGIGKGIAKKLADNGYIVGITGRRKELLEELKNEKPDSFIAKQFDITDIKDTEAKLQELVKELGGLDLLFLSSGTGNINGRLIFEIEKETIDTNVTGFTFIADWVFRFFENQGFGHFAAVTSVAGLRGDGTGPSYGATKAYQINYLESLKQKAVKSKKPIIVTDIRPGFVDTAMAKGEGLFWVAPVEKAVKQIYKALLSKKQVAYITKRWVIIGFILKVMPKCIYNRM